MMSDGVSNETTGQNPSDSQAIKTAVPAHESDLELHFRLYQSFSPVTKYKCLAYSNDRIFGYMVNTVDQVCHKYFEAPVFEAITEQV